ncbi:hypothetical protein DFH27DRAFT_541283 [Peziza echinospora]|nr:hypothetical protein DFH27DRAFT_541283 [Peziza echinospora]
MRRCSVASGPRSLVICTGASAGGVQSHVLVPQSQSHSTNQDTGQEGAATQRMHPRIDASTHPSSRTHARIRTPGHRLALSRPPARSRSSQAAAARANFWLPSLQRRPQAVQTHLHAQEVQLLGRAPVHDGAGPWNRQSELLGLRIVRQYSTPMMEGERWGS